ncbi:MAG: lycopene cyclase [Bacteroidetes bacterium]|nr:lycopene cyclase [Bacteroidota bacterium]
MKQYDYIITGGGCAGLSLLKQMMLHSFFRNKKILLIDKTEKKQNDKTWCFWEQHPGLFEDIVFHSWQQIDFYSDTFSARFDLIPYQYKMIRGIDLYTKVLDEAMQPGNIEIVYDEVVAVENKESFAIVNTKQNTFSAHYVFNSISFEGWKQKAMQQKNIHVLLQHFKGWLIEANEKYFDDHIATFMDFRVDQKNGTAFVYVLPVSHHQALIEYTMFSEKVLEANEYDKALDDYIGNTLQINNYSISHIESGIIPMTNYAFSKGEGRIINIGTAGGQTKGSTGFTFQFIQKHTAKLIDALMKHSNPLHLQQFSVKRFHLYDSILLNVLCNKKMNGDKLFAQLFRKNKIQAILKFLDNETNFSEELKIMKSVSSSVFIPAAIREMLAF